MNTAERNRRLGDQSEAYTRRTDEAAQPRSRSRTSRTSGSESGVGSQPARTVRGRASGALLPGGKAPGTAGVALQKREERERRRIQRARRARLRLGAIVLALTLVVVGSTALYRSRIFEIRTVDVVGAEHSSDTAVVERAAVPDGATLLRYPKSSIEKRLLADPWVSSVSITRDFPHTLRIRITERVARAVVDTGDTLWVVDDAGMVLGKQSLEETVTLVVVRDVPGLDLKVGRVSTSEVLTNALAVLGGVSAELLGRVRAVVAPSIDETTLMTTDNVEILIGEAVELEKKDMIVLRILREQSGTVVFIDVRSTERPVSRGLSQ